MTKNHPRKDASKFSPEETRKRLEAALRGARLAGPKHKENASRKASVARIERQRKSGALFDLG